MPCIPSQDFALALILPSRIQGRGLNRQGVMSPFSNSGEGERELTPLLEDGHAVSRACSMDGSVITTGGLGAGSSIPFGISFLLL